MTYDVHLKANIQVDKVVIPATQIAGALAALNRHYESDPPWATLQEALSEHDIPGSEQNGEFVFEDWSGRVSDAPDQFVLEEVLKLLAPFVNSGGTYEFSAEDFSEQPETEGEVIDFDRGHYRFRDGKLFRVTREVKTIEEEVE